jgi:E3 ubiquitin-protein ligase HUWE1
MDPEHWGETFPSLKDPAFSDSIRHVMDGSLPASLKHVISNAEYYGPSLFLLATDVVTAYVFQEPSLLSSLQVWLKTR